MTARYELEASPTARLKTLIIAEVTIACDNAGSVEGRADALVRARRLLTEIKKRIDGQEEK